MAFRVEAVRGRNSTTITKKPQKNAFKSTLWNFKCNYKNFNFLILEEIQRNNYVRFINFERDINDGHEGILPFTLL